jgi:malate dehydrogenase (oxaloacetate-decarboxylating)
VPPRRLTVETQLAKMYDAFLQEKDPLRKSRLLTDLHDCNETLYFRLVIKHIKEMGMYAAKRLGTRPLKH